MLRQGYLGMVNLILGLVLLPVSFFFFNQREVIVIDWELYASSGGVLYVSFLIDGVSLLFSFTVLLIAANVYSFAVGYMQDELFTHRFTAILFLFILSMNLLIFSPSLVSLLLGWDGLGLTSFLLVAYYQNAYAAGASLVTALSNRIGDVALILGIGALCFGGTWHLFSLQYCWVCASLLMLAAMTKSAQFPFCSWLPLAMAAPTPVSALVHSSTLVTAGVFLLIRFFPIFCQSQAVCVSIFFLGALTSFLAGIAAFMEFDFKKIVAYSTLSQLGVMMVSLGLGYWGLAFFHLLAHAMFKALLFLCVGVMIHFHSHAQDLRGMGNLVLGLPLVQVSMSLANCALAGVPFLSGFYSKDAILQYGSVVEMSWLACLLLTGAAALTSAYSSRASYMGQLGLGLQSSLMPGSADKEHFFIPLIVLSFMSIIWGAVLNWLLLPPVCTAGVSEMMAYLPIVVVMAGLAMTWQIFYIIQEYECRVSSLKDFMVESGDKKEIFYDGCGTLFFLANVTTQYVVRVPLDLGTDFLAVVDQGWLEVGVSQAGYETSRILLQRVRTVFKQVSPPVSLMMAVVSSIFVLLMLLWF